MKENSFFLELLKAGLWEQPVKLAGYDKIDWKKILQLSEEQTVVGLVTAGIEHIGNHKIAKDSLRPFITKVGSIVVTNNQMNSFAESLFAKMYHETIPAVLIKGQGIAQCYERPLWRSSGDIDILLDSEDYGRVVSLLSSIANIIGVELKDRQHYDFKIDGWVVELHGSLRTDYLPRMNAVLSKLQRDLFDGERFRKWQNGGVNILLPDFNYDILFVFCHIIQHFFQGGIGLRQVCDWCRLLWIAGDDIDVNFLENSLREMSLLSEWKAFGCVAVDHLGLERSRMPFYDSGFSRKAGLIVDYIFKVGNFGKKRDMDYLRKSSFLKRKAISLRRQSVDLLFLARIFPKDSLLLLCRYIHKGIKDVVIS